MKKILFIFRLLVGLTFLLSGLVKSLDPIGSAYKIEDYLIIFFNSSGTYSLNLTLSIVQCVLELSVGLILLFKYRFKVTIWVAAGFMLLFTPITYYLAVTDALHDCGCFGDFIKLSNWDTFYKNGVLSLLILILLIFKNRVITYTSTTRQDTSVSIIVVFSLILCLYSITHLPLIDFRAYKEDTNLVQAYNKYLFKDTLSNQEIIVSENDFNSYISDNQWELIREIPFNKEDIEIPNVQFFDTNNDIVNDILLSDTMLWIVTPQITDMSMKKIEELQELNNLMKKGELKIAIITGSNPTDVKAFLYKYNFEFPFYLYDDTELKAMIRSNPGFILMENGKIIKKYHYNEFPSKKDIQAQLQQEFNSK